MAVQLLVPIISSIAGALAANATAPKQVGQSPFSGGAPTASSGQGTKGQKVELPEPQPQEIAGMGELIQPQQPPQNIPPPIDMAALLSSFGKLLETR